MCKNYAPFWESRVLLPPGETSLVCFQHIKIEFNLPALFGQKSGWVHYVLRSRLSKTFSLPGKWWQGLCWRCRRRTSCGDESLPVHTSWGKTTVDFTKVRSTSGDRIGYWLEFDPTLTLYSFNYSKKNLFWCFKCRLLLLFLHPDPVIRGICQKPQCPKDCVVTEWTDWSPCKPYCLGKQTRPAKRERNNLNAAMEGGAFDSMTPIII